MIIDLIPKSEFERVINSGINEPEKMRLFAEMCRYNTYVSVKKAGSGHLGSSFSAMDIITYLYLHEMNTLKLQYDSPDRDIYFSSKGHDVPGLYSLFFAFGLVNEKEILSLRKLGGLDGHPDVQTKGIESNTGSLGMGISKGKGMAWAKDYQNHKGRIFVLTGDGEFQEGQIFESLQTTAQQGINNLTVIIDRNQFQTDMMVNDVNSIEDLAKKVSSFGWHVVKCNGHDFNELTKTFIKLREVIDKPKFVIADTIKGRGISFMEEPYEFNGKSMYKWHSGAPDDETFERGIKELKEKIILIAKSLFLGTIQYKVIETIENKTNGVQKVYVTDAYGEALCEIGETRKDVILLDADLAADCRLRGFQYKFPDRFIENGIAEQDMVSTAGGLAKSGLLPIVNSFGSFLASRANEQIYNNACEHTKIIYTCHFAGLIPAGPGKSHQSLRDISLFGAIPNMTILQPSNPLETKMVVDYCINKSIENCMIRLVIGPSPGIINLPDDYKLEFGKGVTIEAGEDAIIFAYGPVMLHEAITASDVLAKEGFGLQVVNMPWLNKVDNEWLVSSLENHNDVYILEDHSTVGGLGDHLIYSILNLGIHNEMNFTKIGLDQYPACGTPQEVLRFHRLDAHSIAERILKRNINESDSFSKLYTADAPQ